MNKTAERKWKELLPILYLQGIVLTLVAVLQVQVQQCEREDVTWRCTPSPRFM